MSALKLLCLHWNLLANNFLKKNKFRTVYEQESQGTGQKVVLTTFEGRNCARTRLIALLISHTFACIFAGNNIEK